MSIFRDYKNLEYGIDLKPIFTIISMVGRWSNQNVFIRKIERKEDFLCRSIMRDDKTNTQTLFLHPDINFLASEFCHKYEQTYVTSTLQWSTENISKFHFISDEQQPKYIVRIMSSFKVAMYGENHVHYGLSNWSCGLYPIVIKLISIPVLCVKYILHCRVKWN